MAGGDRPGPIMRRALRSSATGAPSAALPVRRPVLLLCLLVLLILALLLALLPIQPAAAQETQWVLTQTFVNPEKVPLEYYGGGKTPGFFEEERFKDMVMVYKVSATSFSIKDRWQDREYIAWDVTINCNFDAPQKTLVPGKPYKLTAKFSHTGSTTEPHPGEAFTYYSPDFNLDPNESLTYSPSNPGSPSKTWSFTAPAGAPGDTMEVQAGLWNAPACTVIWKYEARAAGSESGSTSNSATQGTAGTRIFTEEEFGKMLADTAAFAESHKRHSAYETDLLKNGYIGFLEFGWGDLSIYDHAGRDVERLIPRIGEENKGRYLPIRIGDTIRTGNGKGTVCIITRYSSKADTLEIGNNTEVVFTRFGTTDQEVSTTVLEMLRGMIRFVGRMYSGSGPGNSIFSTKVGTTLCGGARGTDVVISYDPDEEIAGFWVRKGLMDVESYRTGETKLLTDGQGLVAEDAELGRIRPLTEDLWDDMTMNSRLDDVKQPTIVAVEQSAQSGGRPVVIVELEQNGNTGGTTTSAPPTTAGATPTTAPPTSQGTTTTSQPPAFTQAEFLAMKAEVAAQAPKALSDYIAGRMEWGYIGLVTAWAGEYEIFDWTGSPMPYLSLVVVDTTWLLLRIGDTIRTGADGHVRIDLFDWDGSSPGGASIINMGPNTTLVFTEFDGTSKERTWLSLIRGGIRVLFQGSSKDANLNVRAGVGLCGVRGSDVLVFYTPATDRVEACVGEGRMDVGSSKTGQATSLIENQRLVVEGGNLGGVEPLSRAGWQALVEGNGLTDMTPLTLKQLKDLGKSGLSAGAWIAMGVGIAAFVAAMVLGLYLLRRRRKRGGGEAAPSAGITASADTPGPSPGVCGECGSALGPGATFCGGCGKKL